MPSFDPLEQSPETDSPPRKNRRRKHWLRWIMAAAVGTVLLLLLATGPAFPIVGKWIIQKAASTQGIGGNLEVSGSLWGEFSLLDVALDGSAGDSGLVTLEIEEATVVYSPLSLIFGFSNLTWLESIRIHDSSLVLNIPEPAESDASKREKNPQRKSGLGPTPDGYSPLWNLLDSTLEIEALVLEVRQGEKVYRMEELAILLDRKQQSQLIVEDLSLPESKHPIQLSTGIESGERELSLRELTMGEEAGIKYLTIAEPEPGNFQLQTELDVAGGIVSAKMGSEGTASVRLRSGSAIDLAKLPGNTVEPLPLAGKITDLNLKFLGSFDAPASWTVSGSIVGNGIAWEQYRIDTLAASLSGEQLSLEAIRPDTRLVANVRYPFKTAADIESLSAIPLIAEANLEIDSVQDLISDLVGDNHWEGSIRANLEQFELREGKLRTGQFLLTSGDLRWKEEAIPNFQAAATVEPDETLALGAKIAFDTNTRFDLDGSLDLSSKLYRAKAEISALINDQLQGMLSDTGIDIREGAANLSWKGSGNIEEKNHTGEAILQVSDLSYSEGLPFSLSTTVNYEGQSFQVPEIKLSSVPIQIDASADWDGEVVRLIDGRITQRKSSRGTFSAKIPFQPSSGNSLLESGSPVEVALSLEKLEVGSISKLFLRKPPIAGELSGLLDAGGPLQELSSKGDFQFQPAPVIDPSQDSEIGDSPVVTDLAESQLDIDYDFLGDVSAPKTWTINLLADLSGLLWKGKEIETLSLSGETRKSDTSNRLHAAIRGEVSNATLLSNAVVDLTKVAAVSEFGASPIEIDLDLNVPDLAEPWRDFAPPKWQSIPLAGKLDVEVTDGVWSRESLASGNVFIFTDTLRILDEAIKRIAITGEVTRPDFLELNATIHADEPSRIDGKGHFNLADLAYAGSIDASIDLETDGVLRRLLKGRNIATLLPARTTAIVEAAGNAKEKTASGTYEILAEKLFLASGAEPIRKIDLKGEFSEKSLFSNLSLSSDPVTLNGIVDWKNGTMHLRDWVGQSGNRDFLTIDGKFPFGPESATVTDWFTSGAPIDLNANISAFPFGTVYRFLGETPPLQGELSLNLDASGSPAKPSIGLDLGLKKLVVSGEKAITAGEIELELAAAGGTAEVQGAYRHPDVNPLRIKANMPFRHQIWVKQKDAFLNESITLSAAMQQSSLAFLSTQIPAIESIAGTIALDLEVSGSISTPEISGDGEIKVNRLRLQQPGAPSFYDIELDTSFSKNEVKIDRLSAIIAGGVVEAGGVVRFLPEKDPFVDFQLQGREILIFRTPDLSLRTDADIQLQGPYSKVGIRGEIGLVNSRFFKKFDLLPTSISLPDPSSIPAVESGPRGGGAAYSDLNIGVKAEPFSQWTTDVRIYTKDPFLIRTNLVESSLAADILLRGTLERPAPIGSIKIEEGEMSLPFSSVEVETGRIEFDEKTGFNGAIELKARAKADKYRINAYLYNRMLQPKYVLTSVPPMPSEDIITLLVTGTTRNELTGGDPGAMAASKAATLLFKNLKQADANTNREPNLLDELNDRTELDIGGINPETGAETIGGKIRLWKQLFFVGNVDSENDYRAVLKYVFRFR